MKKYLKQNMAFVKYLLTTISLFVTTQHPYRKLLVNKA